MSVLESSYNEGGRQAATKDGAWRIDEQAVRKMEQENNKENRKQAKAKEAKQQKITNECQ